MLLLKQHLLSWKSMSARCHGDQYGLPFDQALILSYFVVYCPAVCYFLEELSFCWNYLVLQHHCVIWFLGVWISGISGSGQRFQVLSVSVLLLCLLSFLFIELAPWCYAFCRRRRIVTNIAFLCQHCNVCVSKREAINTSSHPRLKTFLVRNRILQLNWDKSCSPLMHSEDMLTINSSPLTFL